MESSSHTRPSAAALRGTAGLALRVILPAVLSIQAIAASQQGSRIDVLLTNRPGLATSFAPGLPGVLFKPGWGGLTIGPIAVSPGGNWTLIGWVDLPSGQDEIVLANGVLVAQSSDLTPWTGGIEVLWFPNSAPAINDAGDVAFSATTNGNGSNLANEYIATRVGGVWAYAARERDPIPYLPGALFGAELDSPVLLADGTAGYIARETLGSVPESQDDVVAIGQTLLVQQGVTAPAGQLGGALRPIATVQERRFGVSPAGSRRFVHANLEGDPGSDEVLVVDGAVALQEGAPAPGTASTSGEGDRVDDIDDVHLDGAGRWYARATVSPGTRAIAVREGEVLARHRQRVTPGSAVRWKLSSDQGGQLFGCTGNALGDHVVTGTTDEADPSRDAVAVLNGRTVLLREGDPFDHDGNGAFDDDAYIRQFEVGYGRLDDLGVYRALLWIRSGAGADLGKALVEIPTRGRAPRRSGGGLPRQSNARLRRDAGRQPGQPVPRRRDRTLRRARPGAGRGRARSGGAARRRHATPDAERLRRGRTGRDVELHVLVPRRCRRRGDVELLGRRRGRVPIASGHFTTRSPTSISTASMSTSRVRVSTSSWPWTSSTYSRSKRRPRTNHPAASAFATSATSPSSAPRRRTATPPWIPFGPTTRPMTLGTRSRTPSNLFPSPSDSSMDALSVRYEPSSASTPARRRCVPGSKPN